jgi:cytoskeleton protein RodZ
MTEQTKKPESRSEMIDTPSESLGNYFRKAREKKSETLADAANATRIHVSTLTAIEADNRDVLPAEVFTRGFIKIYAQHLGLDPDHALLWYLKQSEEGKFVPEEKINAQEVLSTETLAESSAFSSNSLVVIAAILLIIGLAGYWGYQSLRAPLAPLSVTMEKPAPELAPLPSTQKDETVVTVEPQDAPTVIQESESPSFEETAAALQKEPIKEESRQPETSEKSVAERNQEAAVPQKPEAIPEEGAGPSLTSEPTPSSVASEKISSAPDKKSATAEEVTPVVDVQEQASEPETVSALQYVLKADFVETTWLRVQLDDNRPKAYTFQPNDSKTWQATSRIKLFIGNAGGVSLTLNDKPLPPLGKSGRPVRLTLPKPEEQ